MIGGTRDAWDVEGGTVLGNVLGELAGEELESVWRKSKSAGGKDLDIATKTKKDTIKFLFRHQPYAHEKNKNEKKNEKERRNSNGK